MSVYLKACFSGFICFSLFLYPLKRQILLYQNLVQGQSCSYACEIHENKRVFHNFVFHRFVTYLLHIKLSDSFDNFTCSAILYSTPVCSCLQAVHLAQASFQIEAFGSKFILDLTLNK